VVVFAPEKQEENKKKRRLIVKKSVISILVLTGVILANSGVLCAQNAQSSASPTVSDQDVQLLRQDLRPGKSS
jgi:hypothetical protein